MSVDQDLLQKACCLGANKIIQFSGKNILAAIFSKHQGTPSMVNFKNCNCIAKPQLCSEPHLMDGFLHIHTRKVLLNRQHLPFSSIFAWNAHAAVSIV